MLGYGLKVQSTYHATTGLPDRVLVTNPLTQTIQDNTYAYNDIGILTNRSRFVKSNASTLSETFHYDELNRLTQATATGLPTQSFQYDIKGNITYKSDVGNYTYGAGNAGPHAVTSAASDNYTYDATGNMLTGGGRTVTYNTFRKPLTLSKGTHTSTFTYGPDRSHYKRVDADGTTVKTTLSIGNVEFITHSSGVTETKRYIGDIAVVTTTSSGSPSTHYLHKDTLGSTDIVTNAVGSVVAEMSFDAFGKRRNVLTLAELAEAQYDPLNAITTKGFTGHEMVDEVGIIHMGGRIYDPGLGRFMSADPIISDMTNVQRLNRYSYVLNNPLSLVDPSGFDGVSPMPSGAYGYITAYAPSGNAGLSGPSLDDMTQAAFGSTDYGQLSDFVGEGMVQEAEDALALQQWAEEFSLTIAVYMAVGNIINVVQTLSCNSSDLDCQNAVAGKVVETMSGLVGSNRDLGDSEGSGISAGTSLSGTNAGEEMGPKAAGAVSEGGSSENISTDSANDSAGYGLFRPESHKPVAGRESVPEWARWVAAPGGLILGTVEDVVPFVHTFATNHDYVVGALHEFGVPDWLANGPTMPPIFIFSVVQELLNAPATVANTILGTEITPPFVHQH